MFEEEVKTNKKRSLGSRTPGSPGSADPGTTDGEIGELASIARKVLMKIMHLAQLARDKLKRAIGHLATKFTK